MTHDSTLAPEIYQHALEFLRIGNEAVGKAREENRKLGIPNVFAVDGRLCWELPSGEITFDDPEVDKSREP